MAESRVYQCWCPALADVFDFAATNREELLAQLVGAVEDRKPDETANWWWCIVDEDGKHTSETVRVEVDPGTCECLGCGCDEPATGTDDGGVPTCDECRDYYCDEDGDVVCARMQDERSCRHCKQRIEWSRIQTAQYQSNWKEGRCSCREWTSTERGSGNPWHLTERVVEADDDDSDGDE